MVKTKQKKVSRPKPRKKRKSVKWEESKTKPKNKPSWKRCKYCKVWVKPHPFKICRCRGCIWEIVEKCTRK